MEYDFTPCTDCGFIKEPFDQIPIKTRARLGVAYKSDEVTKRIRPLKVPGHFLCELFLFCRQGIRLRREVITFLREKRGLQVSPCHKGGQGLTPFRVLLQFPINLIDPAQAVLMRVYMHPVEQRVQHILLGEDQFVHHRGEGPFEIAFTNIFHGAACFIFQVMPASPPSGSEEVDV